MWSDVIEVCLNLLSMRGGIGSCAFQFGPTVFTNASFETTEVVILIQIWAKEH